jgi:hypothetical protein
MGHFSGRKIWMLEMIGSSDGRAAEKPTHRKERDEWGTRLSLFFHIPIWKDFCHN